MYFCGSGWGQVAGICECCNELQVPLNAGNFWTTRGPVNFPGRTLLLGVSVVHLVP